MIQKKLSVNWKTLFAITDSVLLRSYQRPLKQNRKRFKHSKVKSKVFDQVQHADALNVFFFFSPSKFSFPF